MYTVGVRSRMSRVWAIVLAPMLGAIASAGLAQSPERRVEVMQFWLPADRKLAVAAVLTSDEIPRVELTAASAISLSSERLSPDSATAWATRLDSLLNLTARPLGGETLKYTSDGSGPRIYLTVSQYAADGGFMVGDDGDVDDVGIDASRVQLRSIAGAVRLAAVTALDMRKGNHRPSHQLP